MLFPQKTKIRPKPLIIFDLKDFAAAIKQTTYIL